MAKAVEMGSCAGVMGLTQAALESRMHKQPRAVSTSALPGGRLWICAGVRAPLIYHSAMVARCFSVEPAGA